jgi:ribosomal protein S18 acetylase RimI-like enzyme
MGVETMDAPVVRNTIVRHVVRDDLDAIVDIDAKAQGSSRRAYFERRLAAAVREPAHHVQFAVADGRDVVGYLFARVLEGEFGRGKPALAIEAVGVRDDAQGAGIGRRMLHVLADDARGLGIPEIRTQAAWNDHAVVRWLDDNGFALAANHIVDCTLPSARADVEVVDVQASEREISYAGGDANRTPRLARDDVLVSAMQRSDLVDVVRIDRAITGGERLPYMQRLLAEAMLDSAIRVSLTARFDGLIAGFLTARVDVGDYGRVEPVAVLDTIGVHPDFTHRRVGHALLSQLFVNLAALRIERVETIVAPHDLGLLGFLYGVGFVPSQRLPFVRGVVG